MALRGKQSRWNMPRSLKARLGALEANREEEFAPCITWVSGPNSPRWDDLTDAERRAYTGGAKRYRLIEIVMPDDESPAANA